jgi:hypothetical protein
MGGPTMPMSGQDFFLEGAVNDGDPQNQNGRDEIVIAAIGLTETAAG